MEHLPSEIDAVTGKPIGLPVAAHRAQRPAAVVLEGRYCVLEPLSAVSHGDALYRASTPADAEERFLYLFTPPFADRATFDEWITSKETAAEALYHAVIDRTTGEVGGRQSLMRIDETNRVIEIGDIYWGPSISRSRVATEAHYLCAKYVFDDLGYRRFEWKCNALNEPSRRAAIRFGYQFEGIFRQAVIAKGRNRDTAWYSIIDEEWPAIRTEYERWLDPDNFDADGRQRSRLSMPGT